MVNSMASPISISSGIPEPWNNLLDILSIPIAWVPRLGGTIIDLIVGANGMTAVAMYVLLFFPAMLMMNVSGNSRY